MANIIGTDLSAYESPVNFLKMKSAGAKFTFIKVGQSNFIDRDFYLLWFNSKGILPRGGFWFYDKKTTPEKQAETWITAMQGDYGELPLVADFEGIIYGGGEIGNFKIFLERVRELVPNKEIIIYTGNYFWKDDSGYNSGYAEYFKQFSLWIAAYETSTPKIPLPWTEWLFWQFDDKGFGSTWGTGGGSVDLNYFNGDENKFNERFNISSLPVPGEETTALLYEREYFSGAMYRKYEKQLSQGKTIYHVVEIDSDKAEFFVSPQVTNRTYVPSYMNTYNLDIAINADGWTSPPLVPTGYNASEGNPYGRLYNEDTIYISKDNVFTQTRPTNLWNAFSYPNILVKDGLKVKYDKSLDDIRGRSALGITKDQKKIFLLSVDGQDYYSHVGMNYPQTAQVLIDLGCDLGIMFDGGGSTTLGIKDNGVTTVVNVPCGEDYMAKYNLFMRRVVNVLGVKMKTVAIPPDDNEGEPKNMYEVTQNISERPSASMYNTGGKVVLKGYKFDSVTTVVGNNIFKPADYGVTFIQLPSGNWLPMTYKGVNYVKSIVVVPDPTVSPFVRAVLYREDNTSVEFDLIPKA